MPDPRPIRARGSQADPPNRFETVHLDVLPEGGGDDDLIHEFTEGEGSRRITTQVFRDHTKSVINPVDSPDLNFRWSINPYRGCEHGCIYCYARPTHEMLGLSCGLDFETKIFAKVDAPKIIRRELASPKWEALPIMLSGVTDPYQPIERHLGITRGVLEVLSQCRQPVSIVTKGAGILRDLDLLIELAHHGAVRVAISLTTLDTKLSAQMEPRGASPQQRLRVMRELADAGVPITVLTSPLIPALTDHELPALLEAARDHGADSAGYVVLRLPWQIKDLFLQWLARTQHPSRAQHVESSIRDMRDGELYQSQYKTRMKGEGAWAEQIKATFDLFTRKLGLATMKSGGGQALSLSSAAFRPPEVLEKGQLGLFESTD